MSRHSHFPEALVQRYDKSGPRYTSYPPATEFYDAIGEADYRDWARQSNEEPIPKPLSLYFHIPFCSSICYYCACNKVITKNRERAQPYLDDLYREIEIQSELFDSDRKVDQLHWGGGTPGFLSAQQMRQLMSKIESHFRLHHADEGDYSIELDPRVVEKDGISLLRSIGFNRISIGVQDFNQQVQAAVNRKQSVDNTAAVIDSARQHAFKSINVDLIYGLPHQTRKTFAETLDIVIELDPDRIAMYNYAHLPHRFPPQRRIQSEDLPGATEKLAILGDAIDKLTGAGYEYIGMDHFAKPEDSLAIAQHSGKLHRNFQGYSSHAQCDAIGMGISSISNIADNFSQNTTDLETYHRYLQQHKLPVVRGYHSNRDDLLRREIIQSLICHSYLDISAIERRWGIQFSAYFDKECTEMQQMQEDGLIKLSGSNILVCEAGRFLVRNLCMIFDRFNQHKRAEKLYSRTV